MVKNNRKIPIKNYFILGIIVLVTMLCLIYLSAWYKQYVSTKRLSPYITESLREVKEDNLDIVIKERDELIMYMCTTSEQVCRSFEKNFSTYVKDNNLQDDIMYLNLGYDSDENKLLENIYSKYKSDTLVKKVHDYPTLVMFKDGKIVDVLSSNSKNIITIDKVEQFLEGYEL